VTYGNGGKPLPVDRRTFLIDGAGWVAGLTVGPSVWKACGSRSAIPGGVAAAPGAPSASGVLCAGSSVPRPSRPPLHPDALARFVESLPVPPVLKSDGVRPDPTDPARQVDYYRVAMRQSELRFHRDAPPARVWGYAGLVPGPTFETRSGRGVLVEWVNELPDQHFLPIDQSLHGAHAEQPAVRAVVHVHGAKAPPESDGHPEAWYAPGHSALFHYPNRQDGALLWYHDHAMGIERLNQYAGLFGLFVIRDDAEAALGLPSGKYEVPLVLFDRLFDQDGQLQYPTSGMPESPWVSEVYGDALLVNGKLYPYLEVEPRRYRLRLVNASNSRFYYLALSNGQPLLQIGTDQGLLAAPASVPSLTLAPAERADVIVDFGGSAGQNVVLRSQAFDLLQFRVGAGPVEKTGPVPSRLRSIPKLSPRLAAKTRTLTLNQYTDPTTQKMLMLLNGAYWRDAVTETPELDSVEIWKLVNITEDTHPIHLHLVRFQILDRQKFDVDEYTRTGAMVLLGNPVPPEPGEAGWKDTVRAEPASVTRIIARFEGFTGRYVWHCHVLEHAANEMMRPFEVVPRSRVATAGR
jgi:spore coat protein A